MCALAAGAFSLTAVKMLAQFVSCREPGDGLRQCEILTSLQWTGSFEIWSCGRKQVRRFRSLQPLRLTPHADAGDADTEDADTGHQASWQDGNRQLVRIDQPRTGLFDRLSLYCGKAADFVSFFRLRIVLQ